MTQRRFAAALVAVLGLLAGVPADAHHSAIQYDFSKPIHITGVVTKFQAMNPHMRMTLRVTQGGSRGPGTPWSWPPGSSGSPGR